MRFIESLSGDAARTGTVNEKQKINRNNRLFSMRVIKNITHINNLNNNNTVHRID